MTLPDTFVIGAPKAGTTSLCSWLRASPQVTVSVPKEPHYWSRDYPRLRRHHGFADQTSYEALYEAPITRSPRRRVDGSTTYLYSACAVADIMAAVPGARFVVALRQPADLLVSYHRAQLVALNEDEPDFALAWRRSLAGDWPSIRPLDRKLVDYPRVGALGSAMRRLLTLVPMSRVHIVMFDDLVAQPTTVWRQLAGFLELSPDPLPDFTARNPSDKMFRSPAFHRLTHRPPRVLEPLMTQLRQWSRTTNLSAAAFASRRMWRAAPHPEVTPEMRADVSEHFRLDIAMLEQATGMPVQHWA